MSFGPSGPVPMTVPARIDRYRLLRPLCSGGSGIVYEADDPSLGRRVAIKLIPQAASHARAALYEARVAQRVRHPHVLRVYHAGIYPGGSYLVQEFAAGRSAQSLLVGGPLCWREATAILAAVCAGVGAVHDCGILHCDVKPSNLLFTTDGIVKLADFGLARRPGMPSTLAGSPHYMSPEQCRQEALDDRSDVYALGATYYSLLTGTTPYTASSRVQLLLAHGAIPAPDPRGRCPHVPEACTVIVLRAMARRRADRYTSAHEMRDALRAVPFGGP